MEAQNPKILNLGSGSKDHLVCIPCVLQSSEQYLGKFPFSLYLSLSSDGASAVDQDYGVFSCRKDTRNWIFCSFLLKSAQSFHLFCGIQTPALFVLLMFSSKRISLSAMTSVSAMHRSFQVCTSWFVFPWGITLCIWHNDLDTNMLKQTHYNDLNMNIVKQTPYINSSSKSCYSSHVAITNNGNTCLKAPLSATSPTVSGQVLSDEPPK